MKFFLLILSCCILSFCKNSPLKQEEQAGSAYQSITDTSTLVNDSLDIPDSNSTRGVTH